VSVAELITEPFDLDRIEGIAARLDLRQPNREALESIVFEIARHYEIDREPPPFEAVVDLATGVGKTYVLASAIEYLAADGVRNFAVITPGRTILEKTVSNFTPGHRKSLLDGMEVRPVVITSENFATAAMRSAMDDPDQVKLFIFTVQALLKPESKVGRRTHKFQEGLGEAFYAHLQALDDLVVFADEHHTYYGPAFSKAVDEAGTHWIVEVKMDKEMMTADVQGKREAARRWANYVSGDENVDRRWHYLLVSENDVTTARGAWAALKKLGGG